MSSRPTREALGKTLSLGSPPEARARATPHTLELPSAVPFRALTQTLPLDGSFRTPPELAPPPGSELEPWPGHERDTTTAIPTDAEPVPESSIFRDAALRAKYGELATPALPPIGASRWTALGMLVSLAVLLVAISVFGRVEVTSTAYGAIQVFNGPRPVLAEVGGRIVELSVKAGAPVTAGQELARIDATELQARVVRAQDQLDHLRAENHGARERAAAAHAAAVVALERKRALLSQRVRLKQGVAHQRTDQARRARAMAKEGVAPELEASNAAILARGSQEEILILEQQIAETSLELADRGKAVEDERLALDLKEKEAERSLTETRALLAATRVLAPESGWVESLLVTNGEVVSSGATLARVVPSGVLSSAVVFVPTQDAAFLRSGLEASVELPSLPVGEFGKLRAVVTRVSRDVAAPQEMAAVLGAEAPAEAAVRVELELAPTPELNRVKEKLRSGARVTARLETRRVRLIVLLFDFVRRWAPS